MGRSPVICKKGTKKELNSKLMLFYTGMMRVSSSILAEQKQQTNSNRKHLDRIVELSEELRESLTENDLSRFGKILHEGWLNKRKLASGITNAKINEYYERARKAGAVGGKILGAGGGGFLLLYCEQENQNNVREALSELKESPFKFEPQGSKIIYVSD